MYVSCLAIDPAPKPKFILVSTYTQMARIQLPRFDSYVAPHKATGTAGGTGGSGSGGAKSIPSDEPKPLTITHMTMQGTTIGALAISADSEFAAIADNSRDRKISLYDLTDPKALTKIKNFEIKSFGTERSSYWGTAKSLAFDTRFVSARSSTGALYFTSDRLQRLDLTSGEITKIIPVNEKGELIGPLNSIESICFAPTTKGSDVLLVSDTSRSSIYAVNVETGVTMLLVGRDSEQARGDADGLAPEEAGVSSARGLVVSQTNRRFVYFVDYNNCVRSLFLPDYLIGELKPRLF